MHYTFNIVLRFALYNFYSKFNNCNRMLKYYGIINYVFKIKKEELFVPPLMFMMKLNKLSINTVQITQDC